MKQIKIYDIESLVNYFSYYDVDESGKNPHFFQISDTYCDVFELVKYLTSDVSGMVGFNNLGYDYPVLDFILNNAAFWKRQGIPAYKIYQLIYEKSQEIIGTKKKFNGDTMIPQLDLFKIWHYDNKNKSQSLKGLEFHMKMWNIQDMPYHHTQHTTPEQQKEILAYNANDVEATWKFYERSREKIDLRLQLTKKYGINMVNFSDSKIGSELMLLLYCIRAKKNIDMVRERRTFRKTVHFKDIVFPYVGFQTSHFQRLLEKIKMISVDSHDVKEPMKLKGQYALNVVYDGIMFVYGMGGIHASAEYKIFKADKKRMIKDADVASLYPNIAIVNNLYPLHLGPVFTNSYKDDIVDPRLAAKAAGDKTTSEGLKIAANSVYGNSNSMYSFLYDPVYTLKTTINGQLMLTMLAEQLKENIASLQIIQVNTDGITCIFDREDEKLYDDICAKWMHATKLELEFVEYEEMVIKDVNNYLAIKKGCDRKSYDKDNMSLEKVKYKGDAFEITKDYHKDTSFQIIPFALSEYFVKGIPVEETVRSSKDVFLFFGRQRFKKDSKGYLVSIEEGELIEEEQQKTMRYFVSNTGAYFVKKYTAKNKQQALEKGWKITTANKIETDDITLFDIDYSYYIEECNKIIDEFFPVKTQMDLF